MTDNSQPVADYGVSYAAEQLRRRHHPMRQLVKAFYLNNVLRDVRGPTIDLGCGAGQLLARLPPGSVGLEVNGHLVDTLRSAGLPITLYDPDEDHFSLRSVPSGAYETLVMSHVLEHLPNAHQVLRMLFDASTRLGVGRVIVVLPGARGFRSDFTHRTFIDCAYVERYQLNRHGGFTLSEARCFPLNLECLGDYFVFQELKLVWDQQS